MSQPWVKIYKRSDVDQLQSSQKSFYMLTWSKIYKFAAVNWNQLNSSNIISKYFLLWSKEFWINSQIPWLVLKYSDLCWNTPSSKFQITPLLKLGNVFGSFSTVWFEEVQWYYHGKLFESPKIFKTLGLYLLC